MKKYILKRVLGILTGSFLTCIPLSIEVFSLFI